MKLYCTVHDLLPEAIKKIKDAEIDLSVRGEEEGEASQDELIQLVQTYDGLIIGVADQMTNTVYKQASKVKFIGTLSVGMDHIHGSFKYDPNINVINLRGYNAIAVSEFIFGQIISLFRGIHLSHYSEGKRPDSRKFELFGKTIGILGAGNIGTRVMKLAKDFNMEITCNTKTPDKHEVIREYGTEFVSLQELFSDAHVVVNTLPLNDSTEGLIDQELFDLMSQDSIFVSISREETFNMNHLVNKIRNHQILGAALDLDVHNTHIPLLTEPINLLITPHLAGSSIDTDKRSDLMMAKYLVNHYRPKSKEQN